MSNYLQESYEDALRENLLLQTKLKQAEKALEYYANLSQNAYHDAVEGELYTDWWARQAIVAVEALKAIRGSE